MESGVLAFAFLEHHKCYCATIEGCESILNTVADAQKRFFAILKYIYDFGYSGDILPSIYRILFTSRFEQYIFAIRFSICQDDAGNGLQCLTDREKMRLILQKFVQCVLLISSSEDSGDDIVVLANLKCWAVDTNKALNLVDCKT